MTVKFESENLVLRLWLLLHRTHNLLLRSEDQVFGEYKLTTEQYGVLVTIKYLEEPVRITDIARWLDRSTNSVSMIVDRMVKAGLLRRKRDTSDRRVVHVNITSKGEKALKPAAMAGWKFIRELMSPLSDEDRHTFARLLETLKKEIFKYLNPGEDVEGVVRNETARQGNFRERLDQYISSPSLEAKRQGAEKRKTKRKTI
jgi:DNA-binding MarR family transcriptional regulator